MWCALGNIIPSFIGGGMARTASSSGKLEEFAEDLGRILGTARSKADSWLGQRQAIVKQLTQLLDDGLPLAPPAVGDRKSTRLNSSHTVISYAGFCLKKKNNKCNSA